MKKIVFYLFILFMFVLTASGGSGGGPNSEDGSYGYQN